jgi:hypothetical protein
MNQKSLKKFYIKLDFKRNNSVVGKMKTGLYHGCDRGYGCIHGID